LSNASSLGRQTHGLKSIGEFIALRSPLRLGSSACEHGDLSDNRAGQGRDFVGLDAERVEPFRRHLT
jgi:hypothetical protein